MATNAGLNVQIGGTVTGLNNALNLATRGLDSFVSGVNRLAPTTAAAAAGVTNLTNAVNAGQASLTNIGQSARQASGQFVLLGNALNQMSRRDLQVFNIQARSGQLSYVGLGGAATSAGRAIASTSRSTGSAAYALTNLGRVASDAPFGFIAIQNNLDPLIQSFTTLRAQTGSNAAAFAALRSALAGPVGLALGFSVISSLITVLISKYGSLGKAIDALKPGLSANEKAQKAFNDAMLEGGKNAQEEIVHVNTLYKASQNLNLPLSERSLIVDELQRKYPSYFGNLSKEAILAGKATTAYEDLKKSLLSAAQARAVEGALTKNAEALFEVRQEIDKTNKKLAELRAPSSGFFDSDILSIGKKIEAQQNKLNGLRAKENSLIAEGEAISGGFSKTVTRASDLGVNGISDVVKVLQILNRELKAVDDKSALFGLDKGKFSTEKLTALNKAFEDLSKINTEQARAEMKKIASQITALEGVSSGFKSGEKISDVIKGLSARLAAADAQFANTGAGLDHLAKEKIQLLQSAFEKLINLGLKPTAPELKKIQDQLDRLGNSIIGKQGIAGTQLFNFDGKSIVTAEEQIIRLQEQITRLKASGIDPTASSITDLEAKLKLLQSVTGKPLFDISNFTAINGQLKITDISLQNVTDAQYRLASGIQYVNSRAIELKARLQDLVSSINNSIQGLALDGFTSAIESVFSKGGGIESAIKTFASLFGGYLQSLGKQAIVYSKVLEGLKIAISHFNPAAAFIAGTAAIIAGGALKAYASKVPSFATGGVVTEPTLAMIGDNPGRKEAIVPSELWDKMGGGGSFIADTRISGSDLLILFKKAEREGRR